MCVRCWADWLYYTIELLCSVARTATRLSNGVSALYRNKSIQCLSSSWNAGYCLFSIYSRISISLSSLRPSNLLLPYWQLTVTIAAMIGNLKQSFWSEPARRSAAVGLKVASFAPFFLSKTRAPSKSNVHQGDFDLFSLQYTWPMWPQRGCML